MEKKDATRLRRKLASDHCTTCVTSWSALSLLSISRRSSPVRTLLLTASPSREVLLSSDRTRDHPRALHEMSLTREFVPTSGQRPVRRFGLEHTSSVFEPGRNSSRKCSVFELSPNESHAVYNGICPLRRSGRHRRAKPMGQSDLVHPRTFPPASPTCRVLHVSPVPSNNVE
jgi:hypothetical protein